MGYLKSSAERTKLITLPSDGAYWVDLRQGTTYGERKALYARVKELRDSGLEDAFEQAGIESLLERIVAWNLTDDKDEPLPVTLESFDLLLAADASFLADAVASLIGGKQDKIPFPKKSGSGSRRKVQPTTA